MGRVSEEVRKAAAGAKQVAKQHEEHLKEAARQREEFEQERLALEQALDVSDRQGGGGAGAAAVADEHRDGGNGRQDRHAATHGGPPGAGDGQGRGAHQPAHRRPPPHAGGKVVRWGRKGGQWGRLIKTPLPPTCDGGRPPAGQRLHR
eukprot:6772747-Pyramimonas_sp.AAC.1